MPVVSRVEVFPLAYPEPHDSNRTRHVTLVKVTADDGTFGWGECISQWPEAALAVVPLIDRGFSDLIVGEDATQPRRLWNRMTAHAYWHGNGGIVSFAISALDSALWDLAGKLTGQPVHAMLGGAQTDRVSVCASVILDTLDLDFTREQFEGFRKRGYPAVKGGWGQVKEAGFGMDERRDLVIAQTLRDAVGDDIGVTLDVSALAGWTASHACRMARELEQFNLNWLEDALPHTDEAGWSRLRRSTTLRLGTGERCRTVNDYRRLCESGNVDLVLIDPGRVDGLTGAWLAALEAAACNVRWVPHSWSSAINTAVALHVFAATGNGHVFELKPEPSPMQHELVAVPFEQVDGYLAVPTAPGLGVDVDESVVRRYLLT